MTANQPAKHPKPTNSGYTTYAPTNTSHLKQTTLAYKDLEDFIACYNPKNRHERKETDRFKAFTYNELIQRDKANLDIFWLKDESLEDTENLPAPEILAAEIAENLQSALEQFNSIIEELKTEKNTEG